MIGKPGRNDPCLCGSGKKFKKCCGNAVETGFSRIDRERAFERLTAFVAEELGDEDDLAFDELWGRWLERAHEFSAELDEQSEAVLAPWMFFDRPLPDGQLAVEVLLATDDGIGVGERNFLTLMQGSAMHVWEVEDVLPGVSLSLRDVLENTRITVQELQWS